MSSEIGESFTPTLVPSSPISAPSLGSHQTFQPVGLTAWRIALWIQTQGPVGIRERWEAQRLENLPLTPDGRARDSGAGLGLEAGSAQTGGGA